MESLGLMNVMNLDKNKEKWEREREIEEASNRCLII